MIEKNIHYCWFGKNKIPRELKKYIKTWKKKCPDYNVKIWTEENFDIAINDFVKKAYETQNWAFVSDYARLKIIYENGGIYLDTDVELLKSFNSILDNKAFFAIQQNGCYINTGLCFGAQKNNEIIRKLMDVYEKINFSESSKKSLACPILNTAVFEKNGFVRENRTQILKDGITVFSSEYFDPISPDTNNNLLSEKTISIHHYSATWMSRSKKIKRKISNFIGQKNINRIKKIIKRGKNVKN